MNNREENMARRSAEVFHPGEFVREEMEERGWKQIDLAEILGRPERLVSEIIAGKKSVTPETAKGLGEAFGTDPAYWLNLQSAYDLWRSAEQSDQVSRRARLYSLAPVRDMIRRGWIRSSRNVEILERQVCKFLEITSIDQEPVLPFAAKRSIPTTTSQWAWVFRARRLAKTLRVSSFSKASLDSAFKDLRALMNHPEEARQVPRILSDAGVRFVVVEPLPNTRIDGACFWINDQSPVIALSLRFDRIDAFWHAIWHELGHVYYRHGGDLDVDLGSAESSDSEQERQANDFAQEMIIPEGTLTAFMARVRPLYSHTKISGFAMTKNLHPGIIVGQLQFRKEIGYQHSRQMLVKIRSQLISSTLTDGWGSVAPSDL